MLAVFDDFWTILVTPCLCVACKLPRHTRRLRLSLQMTQQQQSCNDPIFDAHKMQSSTAEETNL